MGQYTITTSDDEDAAIAHTAGDPNVDKQAYLEACVHGQLLQPWVRNYWVATSPVPPIDVATGYVTATPDQQDQINQILGLTPTPPEPNPPTVATFNYIYNRGTPPSPDGQLRCDGQGGDWATCTHMSVAYHTSDTQDATPLLTQVNANTTFHITDDPSTLDATYEGPTQGQPDTLDLTVTGPGTDAGTAITFPVTVTGSSGATPSTNAKVTLQITIPAPAAAPTPDRALTF